MKKQVLIHVIPGGKMPEKKTSGSVGRDLYARAIVSLDFDPDGVVRETVRELPEQGEEAFMLKPGKSVFIGAGVVLDIPETLCAYIKPRSSTANAGISVLNANVPIDWDFRAEPVVLLCNEHSTKPYPIFKHQRVCQLVFEVAPDVDCKEVAFKALSKTRRGNGQNGSTGGTPDELMARP